MDEPGHDEGRAVRSYDAPMSEVPAKGTSDNEQLWTQMVELGLKPGATITADAYFFAADEESAGRLTRELTGAGWRCETSSARQGLLRRRVVWAVAADREITDVDLPVLDAMSAELEEAARRHGVEFDGWGAGLPTDG